MANRLSIWTAKYTVSEFLKTIPTEWKVLVPRREALPEILQTYPWLADVDSTSKGNSWEISLTGSGLPLRVGLVDTTVSKPTVSWVRDHGVPHLYHTRKYVSGSGGQGTLTASGLRYIELLTGDFTSPPASAAPKTVK